MDLNDVENFIEKVDIWLDAEVSDQYKEQPLAQDMARVAKACEEAGVAFEAFLGYTAQNPRKGANKSIEDVYDELADVVITGVLGIQHFTKDVNYTMELILERIEYRLSKVPEEYR